MTDSHGAIYEGRDREPGNKEEGLYKREIAQKTNQQRMHGSLSEIIREADVFIGVSGRGKIVTRQMIQSMNKDAIVFALSNPEPEIYPEPALAAGARVVATGRSDFANQVNNAVVFPSVLRALLDLKVKTLTENMLVAVAHAIASIVDEAHISERYIIPKVNDPRVLPVVVNTIKESIKKHILHDTVAR